MKITEVTQPSEQALFEAIDAENNTDILTEDLVNVIKGRRGSFQEATIDQLLEHVDRVVNVQK